MDDEQLCYRFHKRLRLSDSCHDEVTVVAAVSAAAAAAAAAVAHTGGTYDEVVQRRCQLEGHHMASVGIAPARDDLCQELTSWPPWADITTPIVRVDVQDFGSAGTAWVGADKPMMTSFDVTDVVQCGHDEAGSRCLECSGRIVQNIPVRPYDSFCCACTAPPAWTLTGQTACSSSSSAAPVATWEPVELAFPAFVALVAWLSPEPG